MNVKRWLLTSLAIVVFIYISTCLLLFLRQRDIIYRPTQKFLTLPSDSDFNLPYKDEVISINGSDEYIHSWWIQAASPTEKISAIPNEPIRILTHPKVILYFCGAAGNKGYYNHVARLQVMHQLGFSILVIDYRGFGNSKGNFPSESQLYQDAQIAWNYLVNVRHIPPEQIIIYGESLGGAIGLDLAIKHPEARALIIQSSFTSLSAEIKRKNWFWLFPIDWLLTQRFDSISKISSLRLPVLFIHGTADEVTPSYMSQQLYDRVSQPKQLLLVPGGGHFRIYQPGSKSYLQAIAKFID